MKNNELVDYLGTPINVGERGIRVHAFSHMKEFVKVKVVAIDETREYGDCIGVITDGNDRVGWTYPRRLIVQSSLNVEI